MKLKTPLKWKKQMRIKIWNKRENYFDSEYNQK